MLRSCYFKNGSFSSRCQNLKNKPSKCSDSEINMYEGSLIIHDLSKQFSQILRNSFITTIFQCFENKQYVKVKGKVNYLNMIKRYKTQLRSFWYIEPWVVENTLHVDCRCQIQKFEETSWGVTRRLATAGRLRRNPRICSTAYIMYVLLWKQYN